jgi:glyoxalase family protein
MGKGTIHHIAFRAKDDEEQAYWQDELSSLGFDVTPVRDRQYFRSIYFREPGGVLFEIATDPPGFTRDEAPDKLGSSLKLPEWLEPRRSMLEKRLPDLNVPNSAVSVGRP